MELKRYDFEILIPGHLDKYSSNKVNKYFGFYFQYLSSKISGLENNFKSLKIMVEAEPQISEESEITNFGVGGGNGEF